MISLWPMIFGGFSNIVLYILLCYIFVYLVIDVHFYSFICVCKYEKVLVQYTVLKLTRRFRCLFRSKIVVYTFIIKIQTGLHHTVHQERCLGSLQWEGEEQQMLWFLYKENLVQNLAHSYQYCNIIISHIQQIFISTVLNDMGILPSWNLAVQLRN